MVATLNWLLNHWYVFFWLAIFGVFESVRDFFLGIAETIGRALQIRHQHKVELAEAGRPTAASPAPLPGQCVHRRVKPIVTVDGELVGWLCQKIGCEKRLPSDWAVAAEDLPGGEVSGG